MWDGYYELDSELRFSYLSPRFYELSGLRPEDVLGKTRFELANEEEYQLYPDKWAEHRPFRNFEYATRNPDGRTIYFRTSGIPIYDEEGNFEGYRGAGSNLTELKETELALRDRESKLRNIVETASDWFWETDDQHHFTLLSGRFEELANDDPETKVGLTRLEIAKEDVAQYPEKWAQHKDDLDNYRPFRNFQYGVKNTDGSWHYVRTSGTPIFDVENRFKGYRGSASDVTNEKEAEIALRKSEARLRKSEQRLRDTLVTASDWFWEMDAQLRFTYVDDSGGYFEISGNRPEEVIGRTRFEVVPQEIQAADPDKWQAHKDDMVNHRPFRDFIYGAPNADNEMVYFRVSGTPYFDEEGLFQGYRGSGSDVTEQIRIEQELQRAKDELELRVEARTRELNDSQARYTGVYQAIPDLIAIVRHTDGVIVDVNQGFERISGYTRDEAVGKTSLEINLWINPTERQRFTSQIEQQSVLFDFPMDLCRKDGAVRNCVVSAALFDLQNVRHRVILLRDATEQKTAQEELHRLRNYLQNVVNSMPSILVGVDAEGRVTQWNREAERLTGVDAQKASGQPLDSVYPALRSEMDRVRQAIEERKVQRAPKVAQSTNPETLYQDITVYPLVTNGVEGAVIRVDDVTERVRLEQMMIQSEKMLSVGGLAAGMAHEINNPLAGILQNAQVVRNRLSPDLTKNVEAATQCGTTMEIINYYLNARELPRMVEAIIESGQRAARIVDNMLSFARKSTSRFAPHNLTSLLDRTLELAESDYDLKKRYDFRQIDIVREYDPALPPVRCEGGMMQQVFLNLFRNGAEAMAEYCPVHGIESRLALRTSQRNGHACIEIEDNGPGMDDAVRRRVFEPFFTTKEVGRGTGLGLSVSYFIVTENHHGRMSVESSPRRGTRFTIELPIETEQ